MESSNIELITTRQGKPCLIVDNYRYRRQYERKGIITWTCVKERRQRCLGKVKTSLQHEILSKTPHSCELNVAEVEMVKKLWKCKKRVREEIGTPVDRIFREEMTEICTRHNNIKGKLSLYEKAMRVLDLERMKALEEIKSPHDQLDLFVTVKTLKKCPERKAANKETTQTCPLKTEYKTQKDPIIFKVENASSKTDNSNLDDANSRSGITSSQLKQLKLLETMSSDFEKFYDLGINSDCLLKVGSVHFPAHRTILCARSSVFESMFYQNTSEGSSCEIDIIDIDPSIFSNVLRYIYSSKIQGLNSNTAVSMYTAAEKYALFDLKDECLEYLIKNITLENIYDAVKLGYLYDIKELRMKIESFMKEKLLEVMNSHNGKKFITEIPTLFQSYLSGDFSKQVPEQELL